MAKSPAVILYDGNSKPMAVLDGVAVPDQTSAVLVSGIDRDDDAQFLRVNADRMGDVGLRVSLAPVEYTRLLDALAGIEHQLKVLVGHMECVTDEQIVVKEKKK
jgi:hypothetical protein